MKSELAQWHAFTAEPGPLAVHPSYSKAFAWRAVETPDNSRRGITEQGRFYPNENQSLEVMAMNFRLQGD